jgi:beta-phosphoglucomutase-like phosphatase (HAD superfamily)
MPGILARPVFFAAMPLLFDLDGTLIDSEAAHKAAEVETFASLGYTFSEAELFPFTGVPYKAMIAAIAPSLPLDRFLGAHKANLIARVGSEIGPFYDVEECLARYVPGPMALVTSSPSWYVDAVLAAFPFISSSFATLVSADDVSNGKPDPEPFALAASRLGYDASLCTAVEDSANGIASAKAAGCYVIAVRRDDRLDLSEANAVIGSLEELPEVA